MEPLEAKVMWPEESIIFFRSSAFQALFSCFQANCWISLPCPLCRIAATFRPIRFRPFYIRVIQSYGGIILRSFPLCVVRDDCSPTFTRTGLNSSSGSHCRGSVNNNYSAITETGRRSPADSAQTSENYGVWSFQ